MSSTWLILLHLSVPRDNPSRCGAILINTCVLYRLIEFGNAKIIR